MKRIVLLLVCLLLPMQVLAKPTSQIEEDFAVVEGLVVMSVNGEYIVDLDYNDNLHVGDILAVVEQGSSGQVDRTVNVDILKHRKCAANAEITNAAYVPDGGVAEIESHCS